MSKRLRSVIIDDEPHCVIEIQDLLFKEHPNIELVGTASSIEEGLKVIQQQQPDLLFLDIQLNNRTSFELLEQLDYGRYAIVFATAHNGYAIRAFDFEAMAYILKPVEAEDLKVAITRAQKRISQRSYEENTRDLLRMMELAKGDHTPQRLTISNSEGLHPLELTEITHLHSKDGCISFHLQPDRRVVVAANLIEYERKLNEIDYFFRCHKSFIVNTKHIIRATPYELKLTSGATVPCSQARWDELKKRL